MAPALTTYEPRYPSRTVLYTVIADHLETLLALFDAATQKTTMAFPQRSNGE